MNLYLMKPGQPQTYKMSRFSLQRNKINKYMDHMLNAEIVSTTALYAFILMPVVICVFKFLTIASSSQL